MIPKNFFNFFKKPIDKCEKICIIKTVIITTFEKTLFWKIFQKIFKKGIDKVEKMIIIK
jgi:hypothetical protein